MKFFSFFFYFSFACYLIEIKGKFKFWSQNKLAVTEEEINGAICFVVTESNRQLCFACSCKFSDIFEKFSSVLFFRRVKVFEGSFFESYLKFSNFYPIN